jgi:hypothetical protein
MDMRTGEIVSSIRRVLHDFEARVVVDDHRLVVTLDDDGEPAAVAEGRQLVSGIALRLPAPLELWLNGKRVIGPEQESMEVLDVSKIAEALKPLTRPIDGLKLDPANARLHNERNLNAIKASLNKFGQQKPIVALPDGTVIAGTGKKATRE